MLLKELLSKYKPEDVFVLNTIIATTLANTDEADRDRKLYALNEIVILDISTIRIMISNILETRSKFMTLGSRGEKIETVMEFLGLSPKLVPILTIDDSYLPFIKELSTKLNEFYLKGN